MHITPSVHLIWHFFNRNFVINLCSMIYSICTLLNGFFLFLKPFFYQAFSSVSLCPYQQHLSFNSENFKHHDILAKWINLLNLFTELICFIKTVWGMGKISLTGPSSPATIQQILVLVTFNPFTFNLHYSPRRGGEVVLWWVVLVTNV